MRKLGFLVAAATLLCVSQALLQPAQAQYANGYYGSPLIDNNGYSWNGADPGGGWTGWRRGSGNPSWGGWGNRSGRYFGRSISSRARAHRWYASRSIRAKRAAIRRNRWY
jgi:hypothetical protein